ncbi:V-type ATPase 116kDa subunit family protein [Aerococcus sp. UMB7834]|uniref:V-type ATP synthase subunit I n=1 Tax=Aerococcus sp. UMB7834 TaxID=3046342 RepID=UPI00254E5368|nr:V-type ATPase 116kDa subunit family protein [Aerococcus sp. UMB7834]MDK6805275.1 V-type ATPase 116kDa subunit family protein [Aerococcus sp. UMB7834]
MITQMNLVNITGPRDDIDRMADQYLSHYDVHLVNALKELSEIKTLKSYTSPNPYQPWEDRVDKLLANANYKEETYRDMRDDQLTFEGVKDLIEQTEEQLSGERQELASYEASYQELKDHYDAFKPFTGIDYPLEDILAMTHLKFRFGRFTKENFYKFKKYIDAMVPSIFVESKELADYVYGVYFTTTEARQRVDALYYSLAWERIRLPEGSGTIQEIVDDLGQELGILEQKINQSKRRLHDLTKPYINGLIKAKHRLRDFSQAYGVRKYAAITREEFAQKETRYLLIGWMPSDQTKSLEDAVAHDDQVTMYIEDEKDSSSSMTPPTKMKNNFFVRPFELITRMYGVPNYHEMDPTGLVAITYSLLFGAMFGDVGHGILLMLLGFIGFLQPKLALAKMFIPIGLSSMIFGFLYGTIFGFEDVLEAIWLRPMGAMTQVPFFGQLNTVFIVSVAFGMFLILMTMLLNIQKRLKNGEKLEAILDRNGIAGFIFYGILVFMLVMYMSGHAIPALGLLLLILALSFISIAFNEQIKNFILKQKNQGQDGLVISLLSIFFESFETLLTYFSNTISFVRVGAFALSHGAMMGVVLMFANAEAGLDHVNWLVFILGNLFVVGFEGLVVFIQVLRLEFYEIFSHFYEGNGIEFKSIWNNIE